MLGTGAAFPAGSSSGASASEWTTVDGPAPSSTAAGRCRIDMVASTTPTSSTGAVSAIVQAIPIPSLTVTTPTCMF